jgi:transcriptional regulator with PAS, ATPase and Fis domain
VLITGETGSGKELIARAIHYFGPRRAAPLVEINCAALPPDLVESELFGHERGAFTDAHASKPGLAEAADGGTLFLDEIGELEPAVQAKLLRVVEDRRVRRVGAVRDRAIDVRFIAATNRSLETAVEEGRFRADLYYRLKIIELTAPPLRERGDDIVQLAEHFLRQLRARYDKVALRLSDRTAAALLAYSWPGNVRELRNKIEQGVLLCDGDELLPETIGLSSGAGREAGLQTVRLPDEGLDLVTWERELLRQALIRKKGNVTAAAALLNLSRDTMRYRMGKFELSRRSAGAAN